MNRMKNNEEEHLPMKKRKWGEMAFFGTELHKIIQSVYPNTWVGKYRELLLIVKGARYSLIGSPDLYNPQTGELIDIKTKMYLPKEIEYNQRATYQLLLYQFMLQQYQLPVYTLKLHYQTINTHEIRNVWPSQKEVDKMNTMIEYILTTEEDWRLMP